MMNPDQLSEEYIRTIRSWADEGLDLNMIQKKLHEELNLKLTFMDTRFLLQDLDIQIRQPEVESKPEEVSALPADQPMTQTPPPSLIPRTQVSVDEVVPPHALISGKVQFASGVRGTWDLDRTGRLNWEPIGGEPTEKDLLEFEKELQSVLRKQMGGL